MRFNGRVERREREAILRQGVVLPETPRQRRELTALEEDLRSLPGRGAPLPLRLRNFHPAADAYLAASRGPLAYMLRLHDIEVATARHAEACEAAWRELASDCDDGDAFAREWRTLAAGFSFAEVNDLIDRHNRWYPAESRLPMDPATGDFVLVNGRSYRLDQLDENWVLERFPPDLAAARGDS